jgi:hypothetical protein
MCDGRWVKCHDVCSEICHICDMCDMSDMCDMCDMSSRWVWMCLDVSGCVWMCGCAMCTVECLMCDV